MSKIFISHSKKDKTLADCLVDLIETGIGISAQDIFCTSLEGLGIPAGVNFVDFIKEKIQNPELVILLLTRNYFYSQFCLCELGAVWILGHKIIPLLTPPLDYSDVNDILKNIQIYKIDNPTELSQMRDEIIEYLKIKAHPTSRWEMKRDQFMKCLNNFLKSQEEPSIISITEFKKLKAKYDEALNEIDKLTEELKEKDEIIRKLSSLKDKQEVKKILFESLDEVEKFHHLVREAKENLRKLPRIVKEAIFLWFRNEPLKWEKFDLDKNMEIQEAIHDDFLYEASDGEIHIVEEDPQIRKALESLKELNRFIENCSFEFEEYYENKYNHRLNFTSKRFWEEHLFS